MVSFSHNGSERTTWMGYSFKAKSTKPKATEIRTSFLNFKLQIIRAAQGHDIATLLKKHLAVHFTKGSFFIRIFWQKSCGFRAKVYLIAGDTIQVSMFFFT